jgi:hypothetical protein
MDGQRGKHGEEEQAADHTAGNGADCPLFLGRAEGGVGGHGHRSIEDVWVADADIMPAIARA